MQRLQLRFYEELNDFLPKTKKKVRFELFVKSRTSIKDLIESVGVPHTEVDLILVKGISVGFDYIVKNNDDISVYPVFESFNISSVQHLRPVPLRKPKFILDVHLGKLAKLMRLVGFDTFYSTSYSDIEIVNISLNERRTILTRDIGLLKRKNVTHGYFVRNTKPENQIKEIIERFDLKKCIKQFSRCLKCNSLLKPIEKRIIEERLPAKVKKLHDEFFICNKCDKIYWKGTHYLKMKEMLTNSFTSFYRKI